MRVALALMLTLALATVAGAAEQEWTFLPIQDIGAREFLRDHPEVNLYIARSLAKKVDALGCYLADLKQQYADEEGHLGMVGEVLDAMMGMK